MLLYNKNIYNFFQKTVFVKIVFLKISDIDTLNANNIKPDKYWNPSLLIQNTAGDPKETKWTEIRYGKEGEAFIVEKRRLKGTFTENLELEDFPFDNQDLSINISSELTNEELILKEDDQDLSRLNVSCLVDEQEWHLSDLVEAEERMLKKEFSEAKNIAYPGLVVKCVATRRPGFFVWNILIIMTIISSLSFCSFVVDRDLPQRRLQLGFTLTLTGVAFRFVTNQSLPKISYLTKLDKYILFSMIFNYLVSIWHAIITFFEYDLDLQRWLDFGAFIFFLTVYILFQIFFVLIVVTKVRYLPQDKNRQIKTEIKTFKKPDLE
ncbi:hypothetical protein KUTeg_011338 [Tegillarca granosa]|uniref:Neurotransmitter-gated ion-channel transmembrane domain-containing protein n=1 Tax=Tegillarca granosa TaxID=220873 RepID=A0ABQ9F4H1_TEGGR|nr:hypothetical protein KUTeg_011338 [Tegillarca granosa]